MVLSADTGRQPCPQGGDPRGAPQVLRVRLVCTGVLGNVVSPRAPAKLEPAVSRRGACCLPLRGVWAGHCRPDGQVQIEAAVHVQLEPAVGFTCVQNRGTAPAGPRR